MTGTFKKMDVGTLRGTMSPTTLRAARSPTIGSPEEGGRSRTGTLSSTNLPIVTRATSGTLRRQQSTLKKLEIKGLIGKLISNAMEKIGGLQTPIFYSFRRNLTAQELLKRKNEIGMNMNLKYMFEKSRAKPRYFFL